MSINFGGEEFLLLPERAILRIADNSLLIADPHFGKATHFRQSGIPISDEVFINDISRLENLVKTYTVKRVIVLGDFFHSTHNSEWERFNHWLETSPLEQWVIVPGNHDKHTRKSVLCSKCTVTEVHYEEAGFIFTHEPCETVLPSFCGHLHPGICLRGSGRQSMKLPCFFISSNQMILPAFGAFTGLAIQHPEENDQVFAIAGKSVIHIPVEEKKC